MGVMDGIKILELARVPPAEMPAMMLADMGAVVLKIDSPDPERPEGEERVRRTSHSFTNRNKRRISPNATRTYCSSPPPLEADSSSPYARRPSAATAS